MKRHERGRRGVTSWISDECWIGYESQVVEMDSRGNDAAVGFLVGKKDEEGECVTYKAPREKIPII
jgi:hypothetical protein